MRKAQPGKPGNLQNMVVVNIMAQGFELGDHTPGTSTSVIELADSR